MAKTKLYRTASELGVISPMSCGESRASLYRLVQERDWPAYIESLGPVKPYPAPKKIDLTDLVAKFSK